MDLLEQLHSGYGLWKRPYWEVLPLKWNPQIHEEDDDRMASLNSSHTSVNFFSKLLRTGGSSLPKLGAL